MLNPCNRNLFSVPKVLSEQRPVAVIAELNYIVEVNSRRQMMAASGKRLRSCSAPDDMCFSVHKMRKSYFVSADL
jgi:hypothetical protein